MRQFRPDVASSTISARISVVRVWRWDDAERANCSTRPSFSKKQLYGRLVVKRVASQFAGSTTGDDEESARLPRACGPTAGLSACSRNRRSARIARPRSHRDELLLTPSLDATPTTPNTG